MNRWRLNRGGIVNIWQYAEQEFDFSGGRVIFQGTNGSGKSRTLELLLPLCLDGELRQMGSKGFDTVSIRRLMLDDYTGGPNRIGYAWVELERGEGEYLTCGIGVKASKTSQQVTDSWRFITKARVGRNLQLVGAERVPLGPAQLREVIGADCVLEEASFRAKIAETVYGVPADRYADLLHLQRTLRNPDVGLKVLEGQLEQILSDALPPLETALIERLATSFDDLESIRENIVRLSTADSALGTFLSSYSGYALTEVRKAAEQAEAAQRRLTSLLSELNRLERRKISSAEDRADAEAKVTELEETESELEVRIEALKALPAYQGLRDLQDRERLVATSRKGAESALEVANRQRAQEDRAVDAVLGSLERLERDTAAAGGLAEQASQLLASAGLERTLSVQAPAAPPATVEVVTARVRAKPDPDAEALPIERRELPPLSPDTLLTGLREAGERAEEAAGVVRQRSALTLTLHQRAMESDRARDRVEQLHRTARDAMIAATESAGRRNEAGQRVEVAAQDWSEAAQRWAQDGPLSTLDITELPHLPRPELLVAESAAGRRAAQEIRKWAGPHLHTASQQVLNAEQRLTELRASISERDTELRGLRQGQEPVPPRSTLTERDPGAGAEFYRLVDFRQVLSAEERAGLEAALQSSGLLAAWVHSDGSIATAGEADVIASPGEQLPGRTLAEVLSPAPEPGCPVPTDMIERLLESVSIEPSDNSPTAVSMDGTWRAGSLSGSWQKDAAEYLGAGARKAAQERRIAELEEELDQLRGLRAEAQQTVETARQHVKAWERHLAAFPDDGDLITAHARLASAQEASAEAEQRARTLREQHQEADLRWQATRTELTQAATEAGLSDETAALEQAYRAAEQARGTVEQLRESLVERCAGTVNQLADALHNHHAALSDREEAEAEAELRCTEYGEQARALEELTSSIGGEAQQIAAQLAEVEREHRQARKDLPAARERVIAVREEATKVETLLETKQQQRGGTEAERERANEAFRALLTAPGVWSAALPEAEEPPLDDLTAAIEALRDAPEKRPVSEGTVIGKLQALQSSLAGSHNITAETVAGVLTVTVTSEEGPRPVAEAAARVASKLGEQRGYLGERYQDIFSDYLMRDLAERLRTQIGVAEDLCKRMNEVLDQARSSQGVHVQLEWRPSAALDPDTKDALELVRTPFADRDEEQDALLRRAFTERIESERDAHSSGYAEILARALDYRTWYSFTVRVRDNGPDSKPRVRRLRQLSSGETRLVSYVTLFAAAASFYDAVGTEPGEDTLAPLRLVLLDEAFERLDDPTIARMLGLLVDLDMDWIITWPSGWGVSPKIPRMHIFDVLRPKNGGGVACTHTTWDGSSLDREDG
ncbi:TIGR02680 family protein [Allokutzneria sp. A3M-2-11 16]|uniref:TIGR02680 family protein n=1 Tax=Allokutzneria sp. A3M-2-11 16 TaxID=2962043 RepID=UPI0020B7D943|nr:TIGR02680 family protein [Allokutzneria sp. A3M-2-11 16]MCP3801146.1 TIGR02680 family protein [Allokutzneria sp. A3M-2-11 16]